jgi:hypothetical protein
MSISAVSMDLSGSYLQDMAGMSLLKKSLGAAEDQASQLFKSLQAPAPLAEGSGTLVDVFA